MSLLVRLLSVIVAVCFADDKGFVYAVNRQRGIARSEGLVHLKDVIGRKLRHAGS